MRISEIHVPRDMGSLLNLLDQHPDSLLFAGGTAILGVRGARTLELPDTIIDLAAIPDLGRIVKTERFLEVGAMVRLFELAEQGVTAQLNGLAEIIGGIATLPVRNLATVGGNIAHRKRFMDLWPLLACMDCLAEIRNPSSTKWININRLADEHNKPQFPSGSVLARLRIPLEPWDRTLVYKIGRNQYPDSETGVLAMTARISKDIVNDFHLIFSGVRCFRSRELESGIIGMKIPLLPEDIATIASEYRDNYVRVMGDSGLKLGRLPEMALNSLSS